VRESRRKTTQSELYKSRRKEYLKVYNVENSELIKEGRKKRYEENKETVLSMQKKFRDNNKEKISEQKKSGYKKNREATLAKVKEYRLNNLEKIKEDKRIRYQKNKEQVRLQGMEYREKNKEAVVSRKKVYYELNKDKIISKQIEYRNNNPQKKIRHTVSSRLILALKSQNAKKHTKTTELLGCTVQFLKEYLESMFEEGMTWDNLTHDGWHIDHKIPCASFDLTDIEQQKACFHYTNLQPLWAGDNWKKGCKIL